MSNQSLGGARRSDGDIKGTLMARITMEAVSKSYTTRHDTMRAIGDFELVVADRELLVLVGPSGSGKTTLLRLIAGLEDVSSGRILIGDRVVNGVAPRDRNVAMVFQDHALYPHLSVHRNLGFGLEARGERRHVIDERIRKVAATLNITTMLTRKPATLSAGERQRVALGRAIVRRPAVFLLDEPLANLDANLRRQMRWEIKRIQRELATTMVYVTHDQEEAMSLGDRVGVLHRGVLQQVAAPLDIYRQPTNRFVAGFMGSPPMSFIDGTLGRRDGTVWIDCVLGHFVTSLAGWSDSEDLAGRKVTLGIRAEHLAVDWNAKRRGSKPGASGGPSESPIRVDWCEPQGSHTIVHLSCRNGEKLIAAAPPGIELRPGETVGVRIEPDNIQVFESGEKDTRLR